MKLKSPYVLITALAFLVAGLGLLILIGYLTPKENKSESYGSAINRGLQYIYENSEKVQYNQWYVLDYLQRKFDLDPKFSAAHRNIAVPTDQFEKDKYFVFRRIAYPNDLVTTLPQDFHYPTARLLMTATYCDRIPLPNDMEQLLRQNLAEGGFGVTYAAMSLQLMEENNCTLTPRLAQEIKDKAVDGMSAIASDPTTSPLLRYESVAVLAYINRRDAIKQSWAEQIANEQRPDGSWLFSESDEQGDDQTTTIALWALLEYARPNIPYEPMIRRPNF